jgi:hypothetical protein
MRQFGLNSREFYEAVCEPRERPWIPTGALPREPRSREREVIYERGQSGGLASMESAKRREPRRR